MTTAERFRPYSRGVSKEEIISYLNATDSYPTSRDHLPKRALQIEAASRQRRLDAAMLQAHPDLAPPPIQHSAVMLQSSSDTPIHPENQQNQISPALLQAVEYHGQTLEVASSGSERSSANRESSPDPFELNDRASSADQIEFSGDEDLIDLGSHASSPPPNEVVDTKQSSLYLNLFEGVDVFAPASAASDPPTPILESNFSCLADEVDKGSGGDPGIEEHVESSTTFQTPSRVVERLDRLIEMQGQVLFVNLLTLGMLFQARTEGSDATAAPVIKK